PRDCERKEEEESEYHKPIRKARFRTEPHEKRYGYHHRRRYDVPHKVSDYVAGEHCRAHYRKRFEPVDYAALKVESDGPRSGGRAERRHLNEDPCRKKVHIRRAFGLYGAAEHVTEKEHKH